MLKQFQKCANWLTRNLGWASIILAISYWFMKSAVDSFGFDGGTFTNRVLFPDTHEIWSRLLVMIVLVILGFVTDRLLAGQRRVEATLQKAHDELEMRVEQRSAELSQANASLRLTQERLARTEAFSLVMATHMGLDGKWLKVPPTLCQLLGYSEAELLAGTFKDVTHPDDFPAEWNQCQRLLRGWEKGTFYFSDLPSSRSASSWPASAFKLRRQAQPMPILGLRDQVRAQRIAFNVSEQREQMDVFLGPFHIFARSQRRPRR